MPKNWPYKSGKFFGFLYFWYIWTSFWTNKSLEELPTADDIGLVILHVGTNDASRDRFDKTVDEISQKIEDILAHLAKRYLHARILFSAILPRFDADDERGVKINTEIKKYCKTKTDVEYVDLRNKFSKEDESMFRYSETKSNDYPDVVHLSGKGLSRDSHRL